MKYSIEINKIIEGALKFDKLKVHSYTKLLAEKLESDGDTRAAARIIKTLNLSDSANLEPMNIKKGFNIPVDSESRVPIADIIMPHNINESVVLSKENKDNVDIFILSYKNADKLNRAGIESSNRLLMYGPPGCGKTKSAYYIANQLNLPLVVARLDSMISSYLGTTSKNIRYLFEYIEKIPCVLFLDEFDAIAKARDDNNELGELKRVVNSLLQNIDNIGSESILIAATNHEGLLDKAIWRRFDYKLNIGLPDKEARAELIRNFIGEDVGKNINSKDIEYLSMVLDGFSGSEIEVIIKNAIRKCIIFDYTLDLKRIFNEIFDHIEINESKSIEPKEVLKKKAKFLRDIDEKVFSYVVIGDILGISKTQVGTLLKG